MRFTQTFLTTAVKDFDRRGVAYFNNIKKNKNREPL